MEKVNVNAYERSQETRRRYLSEIDLEIKRVLEQADTLDPVGAGMITGLKRAKEIIRGYY